MSQLPENLFANPIWHALQTNHRHFAACAGDACRYPRDVAPFAAVSAPSPTTLGQLRTLLLPGEFVWLVGENQPRVSGLSSEEVLECLQMVLPGEVTPPQTMGAIARLSRVDAPDMVRLTNLAFPGFFRDRTCEMGTYYGVRANGELIAMGGERMMLEGYPEISGVCTHPGHRGKGLAASIIWQLVRDHRRDGLVSWLHVGAANSYAINFYLQLGFKVAHRIILNRICRAD